ncbi:MULTISPECIES: cation:proton antiporter [Aphanothece]|uniref:cation:proton antiporter n=1 Tax=Aphanothece TaxID=1121 RepID=UPI003984EB28
MTTYSIEFAKHILLQFGVILAVGSSCAVLSKKLKIPDVVTFLVVGTLLGPGGLGWIDIKADSALNQLLLIFGSCYLLFDGGVSLRFRVIQEVWVTIVSLATAGVLITAVITGLAAHYFLGLPFLVALLLASVIASTDPATLIPVFRQVRVKDRVSQTVMSESAFNDATGAILTFSVLGVAMGTGQFSLQAAALELGHQALLGMVAGALLGYLASTLIAHERYGFLQEYAPLVSLMAVIAAYLGASGLHASGFMAVFVFGFMVGNKELFGFEMKEGEQERMDDFVETTSLIMRMFIFFLLGSQVDFALINQHLIGGIGVVAVLMLVARPVTVFLCALPDRRARWSIEELLFICWTRETGVIPGALAGLLLGVGAPEAKLISSVTFLAILVTILAQATTTRWLAGRLRLLEAGPPQHTLG